LIYLLKRKMAALCGLVKRREVFGYKALSIRGGVWRTGLELHLDESHAELRNAREYIA